MQHGIYAKKQTFHFHFSVSANVFFVSSWWSISAFQNTDTHALQTRSDWDLSYQISAGLHRILGGQSHLSFQLVIITLKIFLKYLKILFDVCGSWEFLWKHQRPGTHTGVFSLNVGGTHSSLFGFLLTEGCSDLQSTHNFNNLYLNLIAMLEKTKFVHVPKDTAALLDGWVLIVDEKTHHSCCIFPLYVLDLLSAAVVSPQSVMQGKCCKSRIISHLKVKHCCREVFFLSWYLQINNFVVAITWNKTQRTLKVSFVCYQISRPNKITKIFNLIFDFYFYFYSWCQCKVNILR